LRMYNLGMFLYGLVTSHPLLDNRSCGISTHSLELFYHHSNYINYITNSCTIFAYNFTHTYQN